MIVYGNGRILKEPYFSYGTSGVAFAATRVREEWNDKEGNVRQGAFVNVVAFEGIAERLAELPEDSNIKFRGSLRFRENDYYSSADGKHPYEAQVVIDDLTVLDAAGNASVDDDLEEDLPF